MFLRNTLFCVILLTPLAAHGQAVKAPAPAPAQAPKLTKYSVMGTSRFSEEEVLAASGLKLGDRVTDVELQQAANTLANSGMFGEVAWNSILSVEGVELKLRVPDAIEFAEPHFDNFVWLAKEELLQRLQKRVPLFRGQIPMSGEMAEWVARGMQEELKELNVTAAVRQSPLADMSGKMLGFVFSVEGIRLPIKELNFAGARPELVPLLQKAAGTLAGSSYRESQVKAYISGSLRPVYTSRGYLKVNFGAPNVRLVDPAQYAVSVTLPIEEGPVYSLRQIEWPQQTLVPQESLAKQFRHVAGQPVNLPDMERDLRIAAQLFGQQGYVDAVLGHEIVFEEGQRWVNLKITLKPGEQYRFGKLRFEGLAAASASKLSQLWELREGDVFNSDYPAIFMDAAFRRFNFKGAHVSFHMNPDPGAKTVDVTFRFKS